MDVSFLSACDPDRRPEVVTREEGVFFSANWPNPYEVGSACQWLFQAPVGKVWHLFSQSPGNSTDSHPDPFIPACENHVH